MMKYILRNKGGINECTDVQKKNFYNVLRGYKKVNDHIDKVVNVSKRVEFSTWKCNDYRRSSSSH